MKDFIDLRVPFELTAHKSILERNSFHSDYSNEENDMFKKLKQYIDGIHLFPIREQDVKKFLQNNNDKNIKLAPLSNREHLWLSIKCLYRYLRASKSVLSDAKERLVSTIAWRRDFGIVTLKEEKKNNTSKITNFIGFDDVEDENSTGKLVIFGYDKELRPILYLKPGRQNTKPSQMHVKHLVFMLERCIDLMDEAYQEKLTLIMDFKKKHDDLENLPKTSPSMSINKQIMHILQTHYPERLGLALLFNMTWVAKGVLNLSLPFMDATTRAKIVYDVKDVEKYIDLDQLDKEYGGLVLFKYNHDEYWKTLKDIVLKRRMQLYNAKNKIDKSFY